jgi:hypothetical protein
MIFLDKWYKWWDERKAHYNICIGTRQDKHRRSSKLGFESTIILLVWGRQCYGHGTSSITHWTSGGLAKELRSMILLSWFLSLCPSVYHIVRPSVCVCKWKHSTHKKWISMKFCIVCVLLGISPASDCDLPTFRNPLSVPSSKAGCRVLSGGNTQKNTCNIQNTAKVWNQVLYCHFLDKM